MLPLKPRSFSSRPRAAVVTPLPTELTTPPVRKMYLVMASSPIKGGGQCRPPANSPPSETKRIPTLQPPPAQPLQIATRPPHLKQDQSKLSLFPGQDGQHGLLAGGHQQHITT